MATEVEAKFLATGPSALAVLATVPMIGDARLGPPTTFDEIDIYLDTVDGRLEAASWACRLRDRGRGFLVSLKGPPPEGASDDAWLHRRPEIEAPATSSMQPADWPPSEAHDLLERLSGGAPLVERFRLLQQRTERGVHLDGERLDTLAGSLAARPGLVADRRTKLEHALELLGAT